RDMLSWSMILFQGQLLILITLSSIASNEQHEAKSRGYDFLSILPIFDKEIVAAKFACVFITVVFIVAYNYFLLILFPEPAYLASFGRIFVLSCGLVCLLLAGLMYIIIYRWGHAKFIRIVWVTVFSAMILPILFVELVLLKRNIDFRNLFYKITEVDKTAWILLTLLSVAIFFLLMRCAIHLKIKKKETG
ncbi:MAG: ABC-2 transporter permease, partial [Candidatus Aminicenantes bacterium]|nr:ABC-2 transporter permease [Candidatus Aminicenantes bacterium]